MSNILPEWERIRKYTVDYFTKRRIEEIMSWENVQVRADLGAALCYTLGIDHYGEVRRLLGLREPGQKISPLPVGVVLEKLETRRARDPGLIVDVGTGRGEFLVMCGLLKLESMGIDPSPAAPELLERSFKTWVNKATFSAKGEFLNLSCLYGLRELERTKTKVGTIVFCESLEHIREEEFQASWPIVVDLLKETGGRLVIVNWIGNHPIRPDRTGWDHIRKVDDQLYDQLQYPSKRVVYRSGSHLVLEF